MHVIVDQSGNHGFSLEIDFFGVGACEPRDFRGVAHRDDVLAPDGDRLRDGEPRVDGNDFSVGENQIRRGLLRMEKRGCRCECGQRRKRDYFSGKCTHEFLG